jgi:hypothetical protein
MTSVTDLMAKHGKLSVGIIQYIQYVLPLPSLSHQLVQQLHSRWRRSFDQYDHQDYKLGLWTDSQEVWLDEIIIPKKYIKIINNRYYKGPLVGTYLGSSSISQQILTLCIKIFVVGINKFQTELTHNRHETQYALLSTKYILSNYQIYF